MTAEQRQTIDRMRQLLAEPAADPTELGEAYITLLSAQLVPFARQAYGRDGAGVIEIDLRGIDLRTARGSAPIAYYPADAGSEEWPAAVEGVLNDYDPAREAVVLLFLDGAAPQLFVIG